MEDEEFVPAAEAEPAGGMQENQVKKSKILTHSAGVRDAATGKQKLQCNVVQRPADILVKTQVLWAHRDRTDITGNLLRNKRRLRSVN